MTELLEILNEKVKIKEGTRMRTMTKSKALLLKLVNDAAMGDAKSQANLIALLRGGGKLAAPDVTPSHQVSVSSDDEGLVADFLARNRDTPWVFDPYAPTAPKQEG